MEIYKHTQMGWTVIISMGIVISVCLGILLSNWIGFLVAGILFIGIILFASLTVVVNDAFIRIRFGVGVIRKSFKLADIKSCSIVRNKWWYGWGIHWTPEGLLFNISGLDAVQLVMNNGKVYRIGTDEPQKLDAVIKSELIKRR